MYDDRPERNTPERIKAQLREYGGLTPHGWPVWRFVLAQNCRVRCFGQRNHIAPGIKLSESIYPGELLVERVEEGAFWVPRYRTKGWILQRWFPPHVWGTKEAWEAYRAQDGTTKLLAAYPAYGDYRMLCGPWRSIDEAGDLPTAIRTYNLQQKRMPRNVEAFLRAEAVIEQHERQEEVDAYAETLEDAQRLQVAEVLRTVSRSADQFRAVVADAANQGTHLGASEKWG